MCEADAISDAVFLCISLSDLECLFADIRGSDVGGGALQCEADGDAAGAGPDFADAN